MKIEARGRPPYKVSSGQMTVEGKVKEQFATAETFGRAFEIIFDLSDAGLRPHGQYIQDRDGRTVLSVVEPTDLSLLRQVDKFGLVNVQFSETEN